MIAGGWSRRDAWMVPIMLMAGALTYLGSVGHEFVYDDVMLFGLRPEFRSLADPWTIISSPWWESALYRPLTQLSLALDGQLSGGTPGWFHVNNIVAHGIACAAVFVMTRRWLDMFGASVAAALFAVHPVHVEAVANVVGRAEVYVAIFAVAAVALYAWDGDLAHRKDTSWRRWVASWGTLVALFLGLASKESAFAIPGLLLITDWLDAKWQGKTFADRTRAHIVLWLAAVALSVEWLLLRSMVIGDLVGDRPGPGLMGESLVGRVLVMSPVVLHYVRLFLFPRHLSADYSPNYVEVNPTLTIGAAAGLAVVAGCVVLGVLSHRRFPVIPFGLMWVGGTLLVVSNLIVPTGVLLAERSMYLPSVGVVLILGAAAARWRSHAPRVVPGVVALLVALGTARTVTRIPVWKDARTFFPRLVEDAPGSFRSLWVAGMLYYDLGDAEVGERLVRQALGVYPLFPNVWHDYGTKLQQQERWDEAARAFAAAYRIDSTRTFAAARAASNFLRAGDTDTARVLIARARARDPHDPTVLTVLGELAAARGRPMHAMTWFRQAAWQRPRDRDLHYRTAVAAVQARYCPQVVASAQRLHTADPADQRLSQLRTLAQPLDCQLPEP